MPAFYFEVRVLGAWSPRRSADRPETIDVNGVIRERLVGSMGREIRAIAELNPGFDHLTLDELREVYSPDGRFYSRKEIEGHDREGRG